MNTFRERLWPAPWLFISTALVIPASMLVFFPINPAAGVIVALVLYLGCVVLLISAAPIVEVRDGRLAAGKATIPLEMVGSAVGFVGDEAQAERGPRLNALAWLMIRGWIDPVVRVELRDANDPTPYWLISTRHPELLVAALDQPKGATNPRTPGK